MVALLAVAAAGVSGCGGSSSGADPAAGKRVFVRSCGNCHSLRAAGTSGILGGPLDGRKLSAGDVEERVRHGGGGMPAFGSKLSDAQISDVAAFVHDASR